MFEKLSENIMDKVSIDYLRNQVLKNAYGNDDTVIAQLDPRVLIIWYLFFGIVPWFLHDVVTLLALFTFCVVTTRIARVAPLVLFVFAIGVFSQTGYLLIVAIFFSGSVGALVPLLVMTLKVCTCSLASITVFSGLDPDRLSNGLLWFGCPERLSFSISFAYRILPIMFEEMQNILLSFRLRGKAPAHDTLLGRVRWIVYQVKSIIQSFYPLMLNMAKRSRTTVEALELKGYRYASTNLAVLKIKLSSLAIGKNDLVFIGVSVAWAAFAFIAPHILEALV